MQNSVQNGAEAWMSQGEDLVIKLYETQVRLRSKNH